MPESLFKLYKVFTSPGKTWKVLEVEESLGKVLKSFGGQTVQKRDF